MASRKLGSAGSDLSLGLLDLGIAPVRKVSGALGKFQKQEAQQRKAAVREIGEIRSRYRAAVATIIGRRGMHDLRELRKSGANRARRKRAVERFFSDRGIDRGPVTAVAREFVHEAGAVIDDFRDRFPALPPVPGACESPWVTYTAPYAGYSWAFSWSRSSNAEVPDLERYLDASTGHIGSRIDARVDDAGDDDHTSAEYYTGLNVWHVPLKSGPLEVYVGFEFNRSPYSGRVRDEFGFSSAVYSHWAQARLRLSDTVGRLEVQDSRIFNVIDTAWGSDDEWEDQAARQRDMHWYYFKTTSTFDQGTPVLLEGGVRHMAWFNANDESVRLTSDMDLRLDRVMVRSCNADVIL